MFLPAQVATPLSNYPALQGQALLVKVLWLLAGQELHVVEDPEQVAQVYEQAGGHLVECIYIHIK